MTPITMSAREVADRLGVSERTVRRWVRSGLLQAPRAGRKLAIDFGDAQRLASRLGHAGPTPLLESEAVLQGRLIELRAQVDRLEAQVRAQQQLIAELRAPERRHRAA